MLAAEGGHLNMVKVLLEHKAQVGQADDSGDTAFFYAAKNRLVSMNDPDQLENMVKTLIDAGSDVNQRDNSGRNFNDYAKYNSRLYFLKVAHQHDPFDQHECTICTEPLTASKVETLTCGHKFHQLCIYEWFQNEQNKCPICQREIYSKTEWVSTLRAAAAQSPAPRTTSGSQSNQTISAGSQSNHTTSAGPRSRLSKMINSFKRFSLFRR
jgi:hypothetical protein